MEKEEKSGEKVSHSHAEKGSRSKDILVTAVISFVVAFAIAYFVFAYIPANSESSQINDYKKALYNSVLCQYKCPLVEQMFNNKTVNAPNASCVQTCSAEFRAQQLKAGETISDSDLLSDNLIEDIQNIVTACRNQSISDNGNLPDINNTVFFPCVVNGLEGLKNQYSYLN